MDYSSSPDLKLHQIVDPALCSITPEEAKQIHDILAWVYPDSATFKRYATILYLSQGQKIAEAAQKLQTKSITVSFHLRQFRDAGLSGLEHPHQRFLSDSQKQELQSEVDLLDLNRDMRNRCQALIAYSKGKLLRHIAEDLKCSESTIQTYINKYRSGGLQRLKPRFMAKQMTEDLSKAQIEELDACTTYAKPYSQLYKHARAVLLWDQKMSMYDICHKLSISSSALKKVVLLYHQEGLQALQNLKEKINFEALQLDLSTEQRHYAEHWISTDASKSERKRCIMVLMFDQGHHIWKIAKVLNCSHETVTRAIQLFIEGGWECLRTKPIEKRKKMNQVAQFENSDEHKHLQAILAELPATSDERLPYQIAQLYFSGHSGKQVSEILQCSPSLVYKVIHQFNEGGLTALEIIQQSYKKNLSEEILNQLELEMSKLPEGNKNRRRYEAVYMYGNGNAKLQIARSLGINVNTVRNYIKLFKANGISAFQRSKEAATPRKLY
ncbi:helix-turn-helix domain-containing protein [Paenibacillus kyungheensis]